MKTFGMKTFAWNRKEFPRCPSGTVIAKGRFVRFNVCTVDWDDLIANPDVFGVIELAKPINTDAWERDGELPRFPVEHDEAVADIETGEVQVADCVLAVPLYIFRRREKEESIPPYRPFKNCEAPRQVGQKVRSASDTAIVTAWASDLKVFQIADKWLDTALAVERFVFAASGKPFGVKEVEDKDR